MTSGNKRKGYLMHIIAGCLKNPPLVISIFVLANISWWLGMSRFVGPQIRGIFSGMRTEEPPLELERLECPFMLNRDGQGMVVATVANPYDEVHGYRVSFEVSAYLPESWKADIREQRDDYYRVSVACTQHISIPPHQTAQASCVVNRPDLDTESVNIRVYALSDHDTEGGIAWNYESSYKGFCLIQSGRLPISPAQTQALVASAIALLTIGWTFAVWQYLGTISRTAVILVGTLAWAIIAFLIGVLNVYLALLFLLLIAVTIASVLLISCRLQKNQMRTNNS